MSNELSDETSPVEVIASPEFKRRLKALTKRYRKVHRDLQPVFESLEAGIFPGDQVPGTNYTVLKLRIKNSDAQTEKRRLSPGVSDHYSYYGSTCPDLLKIRPGKR